MSSQTHINAILHTRQANPPKTLNAFYIPFSLDESFLVFDPILNPSSSVNLNLKLWLARNCSAYILVGFDSERFKEVLNSSRVTNHQQRTATIAAFSLITSVRDLFAGISNIGLTYNVNAMQYI